MYMAYKSSHSKDVKYKWLNLITLELKLILESRRFAPCWKSLLNEINWKWAEEMVKKNSTIRLAVNEATLNNEVVLNLQL